MPHLQQTIEQYLTPRSPDELDLIQVVRQELIVAVGEQRVTSYFDTNRFIIEASDKTVEVQRFLLNRYWSHQLLSTGAQSQEERFVLIPNGSVIDWFELFKSKVMPFIIMHQLPM